MSLEARHNLKRKQTNKKAKLVFYTMWSNTLILTKTQAAPQLLAGLLPLTPEGLDYKSCPAVGGGGGIYFGS